MASALNGTGTTHRWHPNIILTALLCCASVASAQTEDRADGTVRTNAATVAGNETALSDSAWVQLMSSVPLSEEVVGALSLELEARNYRLVVHTDDPATDSDVVDFSYRYQLRVDPEKAPATGISIQLIDMRGGPPRDTSLASASDDMDPRLFAIAAGSLFDRLPLPIKPVVVALPEASDTPATAPVSDVAFFAGARVGFLARLGDGDPRYDVPLVLAVGISFWQRLHLELSTRFRTNVSPRRSASLELFRALAEWDALGGDSTALIFGASAGLVFGNNRISVDSGAHSWLAWRVSQSILLGPRVYLGFETTVQNQLGPDVQRSFNAEAGLAIRVSGR